ncbi:MAG: hypothetical protein JW731_12695 [Bacteroidales bacterium]|nr:hypothetical protein [Bacteroidales bacterium]
MGGGQNYLLILERGKRGYILEIFAVLKNAYKKIKETNKIIIKIPLCDYEELDNQIQYLVRYNIEEGSFYEGPCKFCSSDGFDSFYIIDIRNKKFSSINFIKERNKNSPLLIEKTVPQKQKLRKLKFDNIGGTGKIICNDCAQQQEIVGFLLGFGEEKWSSTGYQCQKCGKFQHLINDMKNSQNKKCECGGTLSRDKFLFCPGCKSNNIVYNMRFMT